MKTVIDWSSAPEGYPIWLEDIRHNRAGSDRSCWAREGKGEYEFQGGGFWSFSSKEIQYIAHKNPDWTGEGLPPVGSHVVVHDDGSLVYGHGESGEVLAHVEGCAVIRMSYGLGCFLPRCLRTPEQIAEQKRKITALKMFNIFCEANNLTGADMKGFYALYDAGYRKFEIVDKDDGEGEV